MFLIINLPNLFLFVVMKAILLLGSTSLVALQRVLQLFLLSKTRNDFRTTVEGTLCCFKSLIDIKTI